MWAVLSADYPIMCVSVPGPVGLCCGTRRREWDVLRTGVALGGFDAGCGALTVGKLGSTVRTGPPMIPTNRMERTLMWNPHRVLQRRLRVETDWQFIL